MMQLLQTELIRETDTAPVSINSALLMVGGDRVKGAWGFLVLSPLLLEA